MTYIYLSETADKLAELQWPMRMPCPVITNFVRFMAACARSCRDSGAVDAFSNTKNRPNWLLVPCLKLTDDKKTQVIAENEYKDILAAAIEKGELVARSPMTLEPVRTAQGQLPQNLIVTVDDLKKYAAHFQISIEQAAPVEQSAPAAKVEAETVTTLGDTAAYDEKLAALFDPVTKEALEKTFPANGQWKIWAERAARNGLRDAAKEGRSMFNPYKAAVWFVNQGIDGWDLDRCLRTVVKILPARSRNEKFLLTGDID